MRNKYDISEFVDINTIQSVTTKIIDRVKEKRKKMKIYRQTLSEKTGVSYASIRRFEETGEISFSSLLKIARELDALEDFDKLFTSEKITNLKDY